MHRLLFVFLSSLIATVASERMFWFWSPGLRVHVEVALYYMLPTAAVLWAIDRHRVDDRSSLLLALPLFAYVTEGVITPILYTGGPFVPFFPAWFAFWHGILAVGIVLFGLRWMLLRERLAQLTMTSIALGAFWGLWSSTLRLPENVNDEELITENGALVVLDPGAFGRYAALFTGVLIVGHWAIGFVWPAATPVGVWSNRVVWALIGIGVVGWTVAIPWALPMFGAYAGVQVLMLRRHEQRLERQMAGVIGAGPQRPSLMAALVGRVRVRALLPLLLIIPSAWATYLIVWELDPSDGVLRVLMYSTIALQTVVGGWLTVRSIVRERREDRKLARFPEKPAVVSAS